MGKIADRLLRRYNQASQSLSQGAVSKDDLRRLKRDLDNTLRKQGARQSTTQVTGRAIRMMGRGFGNIGRSLASPYHTGRPKISQMPARRRDIGISNRMDLEHLKHPGLRKTDLRGRRIK